ncbi:MAG: hypothetical protein LC808_23300, partial [Actinobacteria bacterium]|nr:hypothetical protein [Actinomycetota bacterium]
SWPRTPRSGAPPPVHPARYRVLSPPHHAGYLAVIEADGTGERRPEDALSTIIACRVPASTHPPPQHASTM